MARKLSASHRKAISEGLKRHHRGGGKRRKYSRSQKRAFEKSRTSKSGHKSYKQRLKQKLPGKWAHYWNYMKKNGYKRKKSKSRRR